MKYIDNLTEKVTVKPPKKTPITPPSGRDDVKPPISSLPNPPIREPKSTPQPLPNPDRLGKMPGTKPEPKKTPEKSNRYASFSKNKGKIASGAGAIAGVAGLWYLYKKYKARGEEKKAAAIKAKIDKKKN